MHSNSNITQPAPASAAPPPADKKYACDEMREQYLAECQRRADALLEEIGEPFTPPPPKPPKPAPETLDLYFAPGCFGFALVYDADKEICQDCPFQSQCSEIALHNLERLRTECGIKPPKKTAEAAPAPAPSPAAPAPTVKAKTVETPKPAPKRKASGAERSRRHRENTKGITGRTPAIVPNWRDKFASYVRILKEWLKSPDASARKLRGSWREIAKDWAIFQKLAADGPVSATRFGQKLRVDRHRGRDRLRRLVMVERNTPSKLERNTPDALSATLGS